MFSKFHYLLRKGCSILKIQGSQPGPSWPSSFLSVTISRQCVVRNYKRYGQCAYPWETWSTAAICRSAAGSHKDSFRIFCSSSQYYSYWILYNAVFNIFKLYRCGQYTYPCLPGFFFFSCTIFFPSRWLLSHITISETMDIGERGMNPVAITIINFRKEYGPRKGSNQRPPVLKSLMLPNGLCGLDLLFSITPCENNNWNENIVISTITISLHSTNICTSHLHEWNSQEWNLFTQAGFFLKEARRGQHQYYGFLASNFNTRILHNM